MQTDVTDSNRDEYAAFCEWVPVPLFARPYWLDAVCPDGWGAFIARRGGQVVGAMPYHSVRRVGRRFMLQPELTQFLGLYVDYSLTSDSHYRRRSLFRECAADIIGQIAGCHFAYAQIAFHHTCTDWLPFHWAGYRETTRYTYLLPDISSPDGLISSFHPSKRAHLRAAAIGGLAADTAMAAGDFLDFHSRCLSLKGARPTYRRDTFERIASVMSGRGQCAVVAVRGRDGAVQSAVFVVWDDASAYQLMSCTDPSSASTGASTLAVMEAIRHCSAHTRAYDFEGSMMRDVEYSYSKYGTVQRPYIYLEKFSSLAVEVGLRLLRKL